jgi:hypothetical protein
MADVSKVQTDYIHEHSLGTDNQAQALVNLHKSTGADWNNIISNFNKDSGTQHLSEGHISNDGSILFVGRPGQNGKFNEYDANTGKGINKSVSNLDANQVDHIDTTQNRSETNNSGARGDGVQSVNKLANTQQQKASDVHDSNWMKPGASARNQVENSYVDVDGLAKKDVGYETLNSKGEVIGHESQTSQGAQARTDSAFNEYTKERNSVAVNENGKITVTHEAASDGTEQNSQDTANTTTTYTPNGNGTYNKVTKYDNLTDQEQARGDDGVLSKQANVTKDNIKQDLETRNLNQTIVD